LTTRTFPILLAFGFLIAVGVAGQKHAIPEVCLPWVLVASGVAVFANARDKRSAQRGGRRTPESVLHGLEILGGWPGALVAQTLLRHKTRKVAYQVVLWGIVALHVGALAYAWNLPR